jgi:hypothetical protein
LGEFIDELLVFTFVLTEGLTGLGFKGGRALVCKEGFDSFEGGGGGELLTGLAL